MIPETWQPVERADGETVGYVVPADDETVARDLLGHELGRAATPDEARDLVVDRGLASLARPWDWTDRAGVTRRVHVVQVRPGAVTVRTGYAGVVGAPGETFEVALPAEPGTFRPA